MSDISSLRGNLPPSAASVYRSGEGAGSAGALRPSEVLKALKAKQGANTAPVSGVKDSPAFRLESLASKVPTQKPQKPQIALSTEKKPLEPLPSGVVKPSDFLSGKLVSPVSQAVEAWQTPPAKLSEQTLESIQQMAEKAGFVDVHPEAIQRAYLRQESLFVDYKV
jgi:hypothetical protein